jgi:glutamate/tyrosine decarboxylase-like PLP-dependent enzyme
MSQRVETLPEPLRASFLPRPAPEIRQRLEAFTSLVVERLSTSCTEPLPRPVPAAQLGAPFSGPMPEQGEELERILGDIVQHVIPHCREKRAPTYFAQMDVPPADYAIFSGLLIRALAQDPIAFSSARAGTFMERQVIRWLASRVYGERASAGGCITSGGTQSNLQALILLRNLAFQRIGVDVNQLGLAEALRQSGLRGARILVSEAAHPSVFSAVRQIGLGDEGIQRIAVDGRECLSLQALEAALARLKADGILPVAVVLTAGTTGVGSIDPLVQGIRLAREYGARVHVDAAHGSMLLFSPTQRAKLEGIQEADTVTMDPHKILGVNQSLGALLLRDEKELQALGKVGLRYYVAGDVPDLGDVTLDGSRALNSMAAWILLRAFGASGYAQLVEHFFALTAEFIERLRASGRFVLFPEDPSMNVVTFRLMPLRPDGDAQALARENVRNEALLSRLLAGRRFAASCYRHPRGVMYLRTVFVNPAARLEDVARFTEELIQLSREF